MRIKKRSLLPSLLAVACCSQVFAEDQTTTPTYSQTVNNNVPRQLLWGDTHLHSELSEDSYVFGATLGPEDAYRFARGEKVTATNGQPAKLKRPLDFLVIADHAEGLGSMQMLEQELPEMMQSEQLRLWRKLQKKGDLKSRLAIHKNGLENGWPPELDLYKVRRPAWERTIAAAEKYYQPGTFTTLHGFEWTSWPGGSNLHRVVVFRDGAEKVSQVMPLSSLENDNPNALWDYLDNYQKKHGGRVLAIPHNGNLSNGLMFATQTLEGKPLDREYAQRRSQWEPLYEVTQIKGDGEAHPLLSPDDEFADYETWDKGNFAGVLKTPEMLPGEYARSALKAGLEQEEKLGVNPFKFGMIGSTDSHTSLSTPEEDNFYGKHTAGQEPNPRRLAGIVGQAGDGVMYGWEQASAGYAAVWAKENTREAVWDAMQRKEVYATTGSRIGLRVFAGWRFKESDASVPDIATVGYSKGVPMGGDLADAADNAQLGLLISALRDPLGANLDRVQVVKGWLDASGASHEKVYNVAWSNSDSRRMGKDGKLAPIASTVDTSGVTYSNKVGAPELTKVWFDPDFDPQQRAFYYVRVLEIPTPRWVSYDGKRFGVKVPEAAKTVHQERAYSSPIWYTP